MKKLLLLLLSLIIISDFIFADGILGEDQNLTVDADFTFLLLNNQEALGDEEKANGENHKVYNVNSVGFRVEGQYDNEN